MIHTSISNVKPKKVNGKYVTTEFINFTKYLILNELFSVNQERKQEFGDLVICLDKAVNGYWRNDFYPPYKHKRKKGRDESEVNFTEVFAEIDELTNQIELNLPWKVVQVPKAEADDIMLVLAKEYSKFEKVLIYSPDKDMIQAQRDDNVFQYSALTKKWIIPENKHDHMEHWLIEHVCLGDAGDEVPKVVDRTEFSEAFIDYLNDNGHSISSPIQFRESLIPAKEKIQLLENYDRYKLNKKKELTDVKDVYKDMRFGPSTLQKAIEKHGSLDNWLDSHPLYREHYERNYTLVMSEGIPSDIWNNIIVAYKEAKQEYNLSFEKYAIANNLQAILTEYGAVLKPTKGELTAEDFGW